MTKLTRPRKKPGARHKPALGPVHLLVMKVMADAERNGETRRTLDQIHERINREMAAMLPVDGSA